MSSKNFEDSILSISSDSSNYDDDIKITIDKALETDTNKFINEHYIEEWDLTFEDFMKWFDNKDFQTDKEKELAKETYINMRRERFQIIHEFLTKQYGPEYHNINVPYNFTYLGMQLNTDDTKLSSSSSNMSSNHGKIFIPIVNEEIGTSHQDLFEDHPYMDEPILSESRGTTLPIPPKYQKLFESYLMQQSLFWKHTEIDFAEDAITFKSLDSDLQYSIKGVLAFFAQSDEIVAECIEETILPYLKEPVFKLSYGFKKMMEDVHSLTYQTNLMMLIPDQKERDQLLNGIETFPSVKRKADWARKWGSLSIPFAYRVFAQACTEGIQFSGSFMFIDYLAHRNIKLPGTQAANSAISRDEGLHTIDAGLAYENLKYIVPAHDAFMIVNECVETEISFMRDITTETLIDGSVRNRYKDLSIEDIKTHIHYCANIVVNKILGYSEPYPGAHCPFDWMKQRDLATVLNFFEVKNSMDYIKADLQVAEDDFSIKKNSQFFQTQVN